MRRGDGSAEYDKREEIGKLKESSRYALSVVCRELFRIDFTCILLTFGRVVYIPPLYLNTDVKYMKKNLPLLPVGLLLCHLITVFAKAVIVNGRL